jgi:pimeloyl-ACP methyl ester carboxylesterase
VTVTPPGGSESLSPEYTAGPVQETVADPLPVEITRSPGVKAVPNEHIYIQYMDLRNWNATFHAPNPSNDYYGLDPKDPALKDALAYAYDYVIFSPPAQKCETRASEKLPVLMYLHGYRTNRYNPMDTNLFPYCAYGVNPVDESETWWFGFARDHDFRLGGEIQKGDVIVNYTEQRLLRMLYDLLRRPPGPQADPQRLYVFGHSMGGSGTLGLASRYPNVFAAAYAAEPISNYRTAGVTKDNDWSAIVTPDWGAPQLNLPVEIHAPGGWADALQKYNGAGVWDWQDYQAAWTSSPSKSIAAGEAVPLGLDFGLPDPVIDFTTQGKPFFPLLNRSARAWAGAATSLAHEWSNFIGLPPSLGMVDEAPFWNFHVLRDESVPGFSNLSSNNPNPPTTAARYNQLIKWSSSWDPWDGAPVDQKTRWQMSFCTVARGSLDCGGGATQTVDVTPRRLQAFAVTPGTSYTWENRRASDNHLVAHGTVTADASGLITVKKFLVTTEGNRLILKPQ